MSTAAECVAALRGAFITPPPGVAALLALKGYAYQALVFERIGSQLDSLSTWDWNHPADVPTFARSGGGTFAQCHDYLSSCDHTDGLKWLIQEVTAIGRSGACHDVDGAIVRSHSVLFTEFPSWQHLSAVLECKNHASPISMGIAREVVGLGHEFEGPHWPRRARVFLIADGDMTTTATHLTEAYGHRVYIGATPATSAVWASDVAHRFRYA